MSDIAGIGSFQVEFNRSVPPQVAGAQVEQQRDDEASQNRVEERTTVGTGNNSGGVRPNGGEGGFQTGGSEAGGSDGPQDEVRLSSGAEHAQHLEDRHDTPGAEGREVLEEAREHARDVALGRDEHSQQQNSRSESAGNTPPGESEQSRTLGQVVDLFA